MKAHNKKAILVFMFFSVILVFSFFSCKQEEVVYKDEIVYVRGSNPVNDNAKNLVKKQYPIKMTVIKDNQVELDEIGSAFAYHFSDKPEGAGFIDIRDAFDALHANKVFYGFNLVFDTSKNTLTIHYIDLHDFIQKAVINWEKNTITLSASATYFFLTEDKRDEVQMWPMYYPGGKETVFDLGKYGFDILYLSGEEVCLIPFSIAQTLFFSDVQIYYYFIDNYFVYDMVNAMDKVYDNGKFFEPVADKTVPRYIKEETWNTLMFEMDYFYGRKEIMLGSRNSSFLNEDLTSYKEKYLSDDKLESTTAIFNFIYGYIDESHSAVIHPCPYLPVSDYKDKIIANKINFAGPRIKTYLQQKKNSLKKRKINMTLAQKALKPRLFITQQVEKQHL